MGPKNSRCPVIPKNNHKSLLSLPSPLTCELRPQNQKGRWFEQWTYVGNFLQSSLIGKKSWQAAAFRNIFFIQTLFCKHQPVRRDTHQQLRECDNVCVQETWFQPGTGKECPSFRLFPPWQQGKDAELLVIDNNRTFSFIFTFALIRHLHHSVTSGNLILLHRTPKASFLKYTKSQIRKDSS